MSDEKIKQRIMDRLRERVGEEYLTTHESFIEEQWEYARQLGMLDPETDSGEDTESD